MNFVTALELLNMPPPRTDTQGVYQAKYWREYRFYRFKCGLPVEYARKMASRVARRWYNYMKVYG